MLSILDLFTPERPILTVEEVVNGFGHSRPTGYRHVAELCRAGLLSRVAGGGLLPGPRILELDYVLRQGDRLLEPSRSIARSLRDESGCDTLLLMLHGGRVVTTHHERGSDPLTISFSRGRPVPMFRGAGSKAILAFMPVAAQRRLYAANGHEVAAAGLGDSWEAFRAAMQKLRHAGTTTSLGELDEPNVGIGAPILDASGKPLGSVVLVLSRPRYAIADKALLARMASGAAARIGATMRAAGPSDDALADEASRVEQTREDARAGKQASEAAAHAVGRGARGGAPGRRGARTGPGSGAAGGGRPARQG